MEENVSLKMHIKALFGELFNRPDITEIIINHFGEIIYEDENGFTTGNEQENAKVTPLNCKNFINALASESKQQINETIPILSATLPSGERVQVVIPPACDDKQFSITIRKPNSRNFTLDEFKEKGFFDSVEISEQISEEDMQLASYLGSKDYTKFFELAVAGGKKNIAIAGATGSGKTTFMKSLMNLIPKNERLITIEDVRELEDDIHQNIVNLIYPSEAKNEKSITPAQLLKSCLRMKPDRILLAELRGGEAFDYINAISSGHGGSITSLHAGTKDEVIRRLTLMCLQNKTGANIPYDTVKSIIESTIDIIVHIGVENHKRKITFLYWKDYQKVIRRGKEWKN
ncbi:P-type DNA transfer ATPase VirB11 [Actinobacillus delphinicola]|uniref:P-type DNA transfer ATPase VirB11 n=1 Tax=Actinobacillus delphinicola TaxID=51161 RepID=UPI00244149ED|nr:P-type DNA transfer ATPase VirB11 [Actinobacillus delphinicola]MDG6896494.1 P-type DNA transfer ATPase VirB11 [Actinobacillus delphinicola]